MRPEQFDADPYVLNCPNGMVDLRTGELSAYDPLRLSSRMTGVDYDPSAKHPDWDSFLAHVTGGDPELANTLQDIAGYALTGYNDAKSLFVLHGPPHTGKTTFVGALSTAFGDYATPCSPTPFLRQSNLEIGTGLEVIDGARAAFVAEILDSQELRSDIIKKISGGDPVSVRGMRRATRTFVPNCKLFFTCNGYPSLPAHDSAVWGRLVPVPFNHPFTDDNLDFRARDRFQHDKDIQRSVLAWAVEGAKRYLNDVGNSGSPSWTHRPNAEFFAAANPLEKFLEDALEPAKGRSIPASTLHKTVRLWCEAMGYASSSFSPNELSTFLASKGIVKKRTARGMAYLDYELTFEAEDLEAA